MYTCFGSAEKDACNCLRSWICFSSLSAKRHGFPLLSSAQYVSPLLCTGQADIANSTAFSMTVPTKFCTKCVAACVGIESYILHLMLANLEVLNMV